ncbi:MAG TPA: endo-1,4-beta-xylanase [Povalibacter sp.]|nr:endo-1,4-beta-xylanase [Povalibacter sp.]
MKRAHPHAERTSFLAFLTGLLVLLLSLPAAAQLANGQTKYLGNVVNQSVPGNFTQFWNQVTPENAGKWGSVEGTQNQMNWANLDLVYNFAQTNGFKFKGHNLVWGQQAPNWLGGLSQTQQRAEIEEWMRLVGQRYPNMWAIDVVNEPIKTPPAFAAALGGSGATGWDWVITSFQLARQYMPGTTKLLINEYGTENDPPVRAQYITIINLLKARGLIDGIGIQGHYFNIDQLSAAQLNTALNDYASTGLDVYVSELDIIGPGGEAGQAAKYQELFPVIWNHSAVKGVTLWGYIVGQTWRDGTGIVNANGTDRQAMTWLKSFFGTTMPNYSISASPSSLTVNRGASGSTSIAIARTGGFTGSVAFTVSGLPSGVTASFNPTPTTGNSSTLTLTASSTATLGAATLTVTGTSGSLSRTTTVALTVGQTAQPDFTLSATPASVTVNRGASGTSSVAIARTGGFTGSVAFTVSGLPSGVTAAFNPTPTTGNSSTLTLTASSTATPGTSNVTITGTSGTLSHTATVSLTVSQGGGGGAVTITSAVTSASPWFNEEQVRISHTAPITALSVTVVVQRTTGISFSGQYNTVGGQVQQSNSSTATAVTYQFTLAAGQTLNAGTNRVFAAQTSGNGTAHPTSGDSYTVTYTSGGQTTTQTGTF